MAWLRKFEQSSMGQSTANGNAAVLTTATGEHVAATSEAAAEAAALFGKAAVAAHTALPETVESLRENFIVEDLTPTPESYDVSGTMSEVPFHVRPTIELLKSFAWLRGSANEVLFFLLHKNTRNGLIFLWRIGLTVRDHTNAKVYPEVCGSFASQGRDELAPSLVHIHL